MRVLLAIGVAAITGTPLQVSAEADTDEDAAQSPAILSALLSNRFALENGVAPGLANVLFGDLDGDGQPDAIVTYSHGVGPGGGNQYSQRVGVFLHRDFGFELAHHARIGRKGSRFLTPTAIGIGEVRFSVQFWRSDDPMCCPTGVSNTVYLFVDGELVES